MGCEGFVREALTNGDCLFRQHWRSLGLALFASPLCFWYIMF